MTIALFEPSRIYTDVIRQDSSVAMRNKIRGFWVAGEHLWDHDLNWGLTYTSQWCAFAVRFKRRPFPPWPHENTYFYVSNEHIATPDPDDPDILPADILSNAPNIPQPIYRPFVGAKIYSKSDYMYWGFDGSRWRFIAEVPPFRRRVEISIYVNVGARNTDIARYVVESPFRIPTPARFSNVRGVSRQHPATLLRNGNLVGTFRVGGDGTGTLAIDGNVPAQFAEGDVLTIRSNRTVNNACFTIVGERL